MASNPVKVVHLSDLHFGAGGYEAAWNSLADHICDEIKPEMVLITGDLVDTPTKKNFDNVGSALANLNSRLGGAAVQDKKLALRCFMWVARVPAFRQ
jgi:predicted MPP superfamily phosphohydrolase